MDFDRLFTLADNALNGKRYSAEDAAFIRDETPHVLRGFPDTPLPAKIRHPSQFTVSGAPVRTFVSAALLICGQRVFGKRYAGSAFHLRVEKDLAFDIMRSHFHHGFPKGTHCCTQCTLAVYPVLALGGIKYFDAKSLAKDVKQIIKNGEWRFSSPPPAAMLKWSLAQ